jgi:outer membrane autotransporter protein
VALKRVIGPWLFAGSFAVANGSFQNDRLLSLPATGTQPAVLATLTSDNDTLLLGGRLRTGYEFTFSHWYLRPFLDGDIVYARTPGYQESGNATYALKVAGSSQTTFIATPSLEIGNRIDLNPTTVLRGYLTLGASIRSNDQRSVTASFVDASASDGSFDTTIDSPRVTGQMALGVALYRLGGFEARAEYDLASGSDFLSQGGTLRLAYHF